MLGGAILESTGPGWDGTCAEKAKEQADVVCQGINGI